MLSSRKSFFSSFSKSSPKSHSLYSLKQRTFAITTTVYPVSPSDNDSSDCSNNNSGQDVSVIGVEGHYAAVDNIPRAQSSLEPSPLHIVTTPSAYSSEVYINNCTSPSSVRTSYIAAPKPAVPSFQYGIRIPTPLSSPRYPSSIKSSSTSKSRRSSTITIMEHHPRNHRAHMMHSGHPPVPHHLVGAVSTDTLSSSCSNGTSSGSSGSGAPYGDAAGVYDGSRRPHGGHKKKNSDSNVLEDVFGIYPEQNRMGHGVSVADVMANKLFKWGSKVRTPSTIPTPQPSTSKPKPKSTGNSSCRGRPLPPSPRIAPLPTPPMSNTPSSTSVGHDGIPREAIPRSNLQNTVGSQQQPKIDDLLARQRQLEEKIQQLRLERNALLEMDAETAALEYEAKDRDRAKHAIRQAGLPQMPPQPSQRLAPLVRPESPDSSSMARHSLAAAAHTRSYQSTTSSSSFASSASSHQKHSRQFPPSKHMQPLKTTPMAIPSAMRMSTMPYPTRPLPDVPIDATPPPEYDQVIPTTVPAEKKSYYGDEIFDEPDSPTCNDMKISFPMPPASSSNGSTHEIVLEKSRTVADPKMSPKGEEIETEEIIGWLATMSPTGNLLEDKANVVMRSGPPNAPLPKPPGDVRHPSAIDPTNYSYYGAGRDVNNSIPEVDEPSPGRDDKKPRTTSRGVHFDSEKGERRQRSRTRLSTRPPAAQAAYRQREAQAAVDVI